MYMTYILTIYISYLMNLKNCVLFINVADEIAYNDKMSTNNMIKSKSAEYSCFQICSFDVQIID